VRPTELEFEIQLARDGDNPAWRSTTFTSGASRHGYLSEIERAALTKIEEEGSR